MAVALERITYYKNFPLRWSRQTKLVRDSRQTKLIRYRPCITKLIRDRPCITT